MRERGILSPSIGIILGTGFNEIFKGTEFEIDYKEIPGFRETTVEFHEGRLGFLKLYGKEVVVLRGRLHYYEGYSMQEITLPVRVLALLGVDILVVTNASGGVNPDFNVGDIILINDHINFMGDNPLRGPNLEKFGPRFPVMLDAYDPELRERVKEIASQLNIEVKDGVYLAMMGPSLETLAEYEMVRRIGADSVGMSTVPEVIVARHCGMRVLGFSVITNVVHKREISDADHSIIKEISRSRAKDIEKILLKLFEQL